MVAAVALFNVSLALGTRLAVRDNPVRVLTFSLTFGDPHLGHFAAARSMRHEATSEAEARATSAADLLHNHVGIAFEAVVAPRIRTPLYVFVVVSKCFAEPLPIGLECSKFGGQQREVSTVADFHVATDLHAASIHARAVGIQFRNKELSPTRSAESVLTGQRERGVRVR
jgi:hypothetical protein